MKHLSWALFIVSIGFFPAQATTLQDLLQGQTITVGNLQFYQFSAYSQLILQAASPISAADITVSATAGFDGLTFSLSPGGHVYSADNSLESIQKYQFTYDVLDLSGGWVDSASASFVASATGTDSSFVLLDEAASHATQDNQLSVYNSGISPNVFSGSTSIYYVPLVPQQLTSTFYLDAVAAAHLDATADLVSFTETFTTNESGVPEPGTISLFVIAFAGFLARIVWARYARANS